MGLSPRRRRPLLPAVLALPALAIAIAIAIAASATATATAAPAAAAGAASDSPATRWPAAGSTLRLALGMATEHWGTSPCRGRVALSWASLGPATNAQSSWANDSDPFTQPSRNSDCEIALSLQADWDWPKLCTVVLHEVGHLTGHDHVDDPDDLMSSIYLAPAPECASTPEPAPAAATTTPATAATKAGKKPAKRKRTAPRRRHR